MAKALKVFIVFLFILSGVSLWLGIELFMQREVIKKRTQEGENTLANIARNLVSTDFNKNNLIAVTTNDFQKMRAEQNKLAAHAKITYDNLVQNGVDYTNTLARLDQTNAVLAQTIQTLNDRIAEVEQLNQTVAQKNMEIAQKEGQISELTMAKANLEQQVRDRDDKIAHQEDVIKDLKDEIRVAEEDIKRISAELVACMNPRGDDAYIRPGTAGRILEVNDEWNFVVLNLGTNNGMVPNGTMIVHRGDKMLGRVRIASVAKDMCIATIERDWQQGQFQEGDFVVR